MPYRAPAPFDPEHALRWLCSERVVDGQGSVCSWHNTDHPGYPYPEAGGVLLSLLAWRRHRGTQRSPVADRIAQSLLRLAEADAIGRDGVRFTFDEGVVLAGLIRHARGGGAIPMTRLRPLLDRWVARLTAMDVGGPKETVEPPRWSGRVGPHLLKAATTLGVWPDLETEHRRAMATLWRHAAPRRGGRFVTETPDAPSYVHAHCYAVEGALRLAVGDLCTPPIAEQAARAARRGATWLASIQASTGALPAWHDGTRGTGPEATDATAQAIRIWSVVDRRGFAAAIDRGLSALARVTASSGALHYRPGSRDENTWATAFGVQAALFATHGGSVAWLI